MRRCLVGLAAFVLLSAPLQAQEADEPEVLTRLYVVRDADPAGGRSSGPARGGVPVAASLGLVDVTELGVATESVDPTGDVRLTWVASQMRVLSRWGGPVTDTSLPVRWVLVDADPGDESVVVLTRGGPGRRADAALVHESADAFIVDDGRLALRVPLDGQSALASTRLRASNFDPAQPTGLADDGVRVELILPGDDGRERVFVAPHAADVTIEEAGPLRSTILVRSSFVGANGAPLRDGDVRAELRLTMRTGTGVVDVDLDVINDSDAPLDVTACRLVAPTRFDGEISCVTSDVDVAARRIELRQRHTLLRRDDESANLSYELTADGVVVAQGARSDGALMLRDDRRSMAVAVRSFWEAYPTAISHADGVLRVATLARGPAPHTLAPGRRVLSSLRLGFDADTATSTGCERLVADTAWISASGALVPLAPFAPDLGDEVRTSAARHLDRLQEGLLDVRACDAQGPVGSVAPASLETQRERRGAANPALPYDVDLYGWRRFGDVVDVDGVAGGGHRWVRGLCRAYLARRDARFLDAALDLARPRLANEHTAHAARAVGGLLLLHALTGDGRFLRTAEQTVLGLGDDAGVDGVAAALALHAHTGDRAALHTALRIHEPMLAASERGIAAPPTPSTVAMLRSHELVHRATGDRRALAALLRGLRNVISAGYEGTGRVVGEAYLPLQLHGPGGPEPLHTPVGLAVADRLAYAYAATGEEWYIDRARRIFRDAVLFLQAPPMAIVAPGYHARVGAAPLRHPGREIEFGALLLDGSPWLVAGDARRVADGLSVPLTSEPVLVATAAATVHGAERAPVVGDGGDLAEGEVPAVPDVGTTLPVEIVVDDADAILAGRWTSREQQGALRGAQNVASRGSEGAIASFVVPLPFEGRVRVYALWQPVREPAAVARIRMDAADGPVQVVVDTARGGGRWRLLGEVRVGASTPLRVDVGRDSLAGALAIDGLRVEPVR